MAVTKANIGECKSAKATVSIDWLRLARLYYDNFNKRPPKSFCGDLYIDKKTGGLYQGCLKVKFKKDVVACTVEAKVYFAKLAQSKAPHQSTMDIRKTKSNKPVVGEM